jgi:hypothetical protein
VNAWSEISAMIASFLIAVAFAAAARAGLAVPTHIALVTTVAATTLVWLTVTWLTPPTDRRTLIAFYELARPAGPGWGSVRTEARAPASPDSLAHAALASVLGCALVYSALFGSGSMLFGHYPQALVWGVVFVASGAALWRTIPPARSEPGS